MTDEWLGYQFDVCVLQFGRQVEAKTADGKTSVERALQDVANASRRTRKPAPSLGALSAQAVAVEKLPWE